MQLLQKGGVQPVGNVRDSQGGGDGLLVEFVEGFLDHPAFLKRRQAIHHAIAGEGLLLRGKNAGHGLHPQLQQDAVTLMSVEDDVVVVLGKDQQRFNETDGKNARPDSFVFPFADLAIVPGPEQHQRNVATLNNHG